MLAMHDSGEKHFRRVETRAASQPHSWSVSGVSEETIAAAKEAAERYNMSLGEWVDQALREAARAGLRAARPHAPSDPRPTRRYF